MTITKVAQRRQDRIASIVEVAWRLARQHGIQLVSLHAIAKEIGIRQPSLYAYFDSKNALYDAMFADGNQQLLARLSALDLPADPRAALKTFMRTFTDFAVEDPARNSLLFLRVVPGFEPTPESYAIASEALSRVGAVLAAAGVSDPGDVDCMVAMVAGLIEAQLSNEPGGDRWTRHLDRMVDLLADHANERNAR